MIKQHVLMMAEGASGGGGGGAPDRWQSFVATLPEQYREDPDQFVKAYAATTAEKETLTTQLQEAARVKQWYDQTYMPWVADNRASLSAYEQWKRSGGQVPSPDAGTTPPPAPHTTASRRVSEAVDWNEPDAPQKALDMLEDRYDARLRTAENTTTLTRQEFTQARDTFVSLLGMLRQAETIEHQDLYEHVGYTPRYDLNKIAAYASERGITDFTLARDQLYQSQTIEAHERRAVANARKQWEQEQNNKAIHTEHGPGVPPRGMDFRRQHALPSPEGSGRRQDDAVLYAEIAKKHPDLAWS